MADNEKAFHRQLPSEEWRLLHHEGTIRGCLPTHARFHNPKLGVEVEWSARGHRKGRNTVVVSTPQTQHKVHTRRFPRLTGWEPGNVSWWVAEFFTWGSIFWVINGFFVFTPTSNANVNLYMVGYSALVGGTLFEIGAYLMVVEALNVGHTVRFGYEVERALEEGALVLRPHRHYHHRKPLPRQPASSGPAPGRGGGANGSALKNGTAAAVDDALPSNRGNGKHSAPPQHALEYDSPPSQRAAPMHEAPPKWRWWGFEPLELGYWGSFTSFVAATIFWIATITGVPNALPENATNVGLWDSLYWTPQVIGGMGFIISSICFISKTYAPVIGGMGFIIGSTCFMLETQRTWWRLEPLKLGWHVGFWNLIGAFGFFFSGVFGYWAVPAMRYQKWGTYFSTFWGGWAFLIGSYIQLYEVLNPHPKERKES